ncbi:Respiratory supercomplex factor 1, mitochondrial [Gnomoniopsis smithogilvyi]|uniref:Respiratory supercomplex factor 1, mitochondrial n=1 Tax=Gnomoniopsis smithogilvyi TaxID=1191159 RepID=A0A9W9CZT9_9PEZI|nr:Respiratory supercomplex factor 1, mitochondrial [Gnomoniopsis smithogilvyi]
MASPTSGRPLPSSFDDNDEFYNESGFQKVIGRMKREPLVPFGCLLTVAAFTNAYRAMRKGDHHQVQRMFRARVAAQGFTVVCMVAGGLYFGAERHKERETWKAAEEEKAEEKRQKWIRELEARDEEEKELKARLERRREKKRTADREEARKAFREAEAKKEANEVASVSEGAETSRGGSGWSLGGLLGGSKGQGEASEEPPQPTPASELPKK